MEVRMRYNDDDLELRESEDLYSETRNRRFLAKEDVGDGLIGTIRQAGRAKIDFGGYGETEEHTVILWKEDIKPFICNATNAWEISQIAGSTDSRKWVDVHVELYHEKKVPFGGKIVGGIRVRRPGTGPSSKITPVVAQPPPAPKPTTGTRKRKP